jgi:V8-like Glu-specific endopeptidase
MAHESRPKLVTPRNRNALYRIPRLGPQNTVIDSIHVDFPQIMTDAYPWCTIGMVNSGRDLNYGAPEKQGTGVLVGPNLMLTASHMVPWGEPGWYMRFDAASFDGGNMGQSYVASTSGYTSPDSGGDRAHDYALCTLYMPLGNTLGWMGTHGTTDESFYENGDWTTVGYPGSSPRPQVEMLVKVTDASESDDGQKMSTDFVTKPGWSGGPLWAYIDDQPKVVGICSGEGDTAWEWLSGDEHGIFSGGPDMVGLLKFHELVAGISGGIHASDPPIVFR